jgi:hypothetical protein
MDLTRLKRRIKNKMPFVKFPLKANIYKPVGDGLKFITTDGLRKDLLQEKEVYVFKSNADIILNPPFGLEDAGNTVDILQIGEGDYVFMQRKVFYRDKEEKENKIHDLSFEIRLDEQAKFLFANQLELIYSRFEKDKGFLEKYGATVVLIFALAIAGTIILVGSTSNISALTVATKGLSDAISSNTGALNAFTQAAGSVSTAP